MRVLIATDAWSPQVNGVVFALKNLAAHAERQGLQIEFLTPDGFFSVPMPTYPEIRLALATPGAVERRIRGSRFDHVHIATEGPIGIAVRALCRKRDWPFTTSFHTRFPEYIHARTGVPLSWSYAWMRRFHSAAICTMVATRSLRDELQAAGFRNLAFWSRGVDTAIFRPEGRDALPYPRPVFLYVGRVAVEKNIDAFLSLDLPGTKVVIGDGPARSRLEKLHPTAVFLGAKEQRNLAPFYSSADVFVFPSRTDTFGMVLIEALACGLPVAAYPVPGPRDVLGDSEAGVLHADLRTACIEALAISREAARTHALRFTWDGSAKQFADNIRKARAGTWPDVSYTHAPPAGTQEIKGPLDRR